LRYDVSASQIGEIRLARPDELELKLVEISPDDMASATLDPYTFAPGHYRIPAVSLVAESTDYDPSGLLGWFPDFNCFGSWDTEHGPMLLFPGVGWSTIVDDAFRYLDEMWEQSGLGVSPLPWLTHPYHLEELEAVFPPHAGDCPAHGAALVTRTAVKRAPVIARLANTLRERELPEYVEERNSSFPFPGVPVSENEEVLCLACRASEDQWFTPFLDEEPLSVTPNQHGFVHCPACERSFNQTNSEVYAFGFHLSCGTRLRILGLAPAN
jgi:hypothetical protein